MAATLIGVGAGLVCLSPLLSAKVTLTWSYDYTATAACTAELAQNCIDHFEILDLSNQASPRLLKLVANPSGAHGKVDGIGMTFRYGPPFGERTFSVVAVLKTVRGFIRSNPFAARRTVQVYPWGRRGRT